MATIEIISAVVLIAVLVVLAIQDWKTRSISAWLLAPLALTISFTAYYSLSLDEIGARLIESVGLVLILLGTVWMYFKIKQQLTKEAAPVILGLGDVLVMTILSVSFASFGVVLFIIASCLFGILTHVLMSGFKSANQKSVPFVSYLSVTYILWLALDQLEIIPGMGASNVTWLHHLTQLLG